MVSLLTDVEDELIAFQHLRAKMRLSETSLKINTPFNVVTYNYDSMYVPGLATRLFVEIVSETNHNIFASSMRKQKYYDLFS